MRSNIKNNGRAVLLALLAVGTLVPVSTRAQWASIRGNNRGAHESRETPRGPNQVARHEEGRRGDERAHEEHRLDAARHWTEEARHRDIDEDRRRSYFWSGVHAGGFFRSLPAGYAQIYVGGAPYYYYQGAYYEPEQSGYVAVTPPIGAVVPTLPPGAEGVPVGQTVYYYVGGAFYMPQPQGFVVVVPPLGVTVGSLPPNATPVYIRGGLYYQANGVYFLPNIQGGVTVYTTVQP